MKRMLGVAMVLLVAAGWNLAFGQISASLTNWVLGATVPVIETGTLPDALTGPYINVPVGTSPFYYEVDSTGEGMAEFLDL